MQEPSVAPAYVFSTGAQNNFMIKRWGQTDKTDVSGEVTNGNVVVGPILGTWHVAGGTSHHVATATVGDATPNISTGRLWRVANTSNTTITNFDNAVDGQLVTLHFTNSNTTLQSNASVALSTGANFSATTDDTITLQFSSNKWVELSRSVNA